MTDASILTDTTQLQGPQAEQDKGTYKVWHKTGTVGGPAGKYLVDNSGKAVYLVDPGINGAYNKRPDGTEVKKYDAPKAVLMSYIIKGILDQQLPWTLVLFGVMIAVVLEMAAEAGLYFDRHSRWDRIKHAGATLPVCGKSDCNGSRL